MSISATTLALILGGVSGIGSSALNVGANYLLQKDSQKFNRTEAEKARDFAHEEALLAREHSTAEALKAREFTQQMDNTKYQRTMNDLSQAGINPNAVFGSGGAASGVSSSMAQSASAAGVAPASTSAPSAYTQLIDSSLAELFSDKGVANKLVKTISSNAKEDKPFNELKPEDMMSEEQIKLAESYREKSINAYKKGTRPRYTKAEKNAYEYYQKLSDNLGVL